MPILILGLGLIAPFALLLWASRDARRLATSDPAAAWFSFAQRGQWITVAGLLGWPMLTGTYAGRLLIAALRERLDLPLGALAAAVVIVPPAALIAMAGYLSEDLARRVRGIEIRRAESLRNAVLRATGLIAPVVGLTSAYEVMRQGETLWALIVACAALSIAVMALAVSGGRARMTPHAITSGPLRDRVFALAERAGVTLQQLYVVPMTRIRMANAFAVQGQRVILTDYLLQHLDRDEVDAVLAHEMAHLKLGHPRMLGIGFLALLTVAITSSMVWHVPGAPAVILLPGLIAYFAISRRFEYAADAGALELGGSAEALITGLVRLNRLNHVPMRWSRAREWLLTHPSTERRALAIARRAQLGGERVATLLAAALAPGARAAEQSAAPEQSYAMPASVTHRKVFDTPFKQEYMRRLGFTLLGMSVFVPAVIAVFAMVMRAPMSLLAYALVAALATALTCVAVVQVAATAPFRGVAQRLARRRTEEGFDPRAAGARFVGLAPDPRVRLYEGFGAWDVGFLALGSGRLDYVGEEARFTLAAEDVVGLRLVDGIPGWSPVPRVRVDWRRPDGLTGCFTVSAMGSLTLIGAAHASRALCEELVRWRRTAPPRAQAAASRAPWMGTPPITAVTSVSPAAHRSLAGLLQALVLQSVMVLVVLLVLRVPLWSGRNPGWFEITGAAFIGYLLTLLPLLRWHEPQAPATPAREPQRRAA